MSIFKKDEEHSHPLSMVVHLNIWYSEVLYHTKLMDVIGRISLLLTREHTMTTSTTNYYHY